MTEHPRALLALGPIKIRGELALSRDARRLIRAILERNRVPSPLAERFIKDVDLRLWGYRRASPFPRHEFPRLDRQSSEVYRLEDLREASLTILRVLAHPPGDLAERMRGWGLPDRAEPDLLHLLHFAAHALAESRIPRGTNRRMDPGTIAEHRLIARALRRHFGTRFALTAAPGGVLDKIAAAALGDSYSLAALKIAIR